MATCRRFALLSLFVLALMGCSNEGSSAPSAAPPAPAAAPDTSAPTAATPNAPPPATSFADKADNAIDRAAADAKAFFHTAQDKFTHLRDDSQQFIDQHKPQADSDAQKAMDDLKSAMHHANDEITKLNAQGAEAWKQNKPRVDAALADLRAKFEEAKAKISNPPATQPGN